MSTETIAVLGAGPGGLEAARGVAELGVPVVLIEKRDFMGGTPIAESYSALTPYMEDAEPALKAMADRVTSNPLVDVRMGAEVIACEGEPGSYRLTLKTGSGEATVDVAGVIVATGFQHFDPGRETQMYGYYEYPDVITLPDLEVMLKAHDIRRPSNGEVPERVCFIQCVGSRDRHIGNEYCSKVCCGIASKEAIEIRQMLPNSQVFIFYIDMRMYGYWENRIYWPAQEKHHVQYVKGIVTEVLAKGDKLLVRGEDTTMGRPMEVLMDMVVLSVGMEPSAGTRQAAKLLGAEQNKYGFIDAVRGPLDTVSTSREGIWACGAALGPADLEDTVSSASAAAIRAVGFVRSRTESQPA